LCEALQGSYRYIAEQRNQIVTTGGSLTASQAGNQLVENLPAHARRSGIIAQQAAQ
jgi:hypothetical protein